MPIKVEQDQPLSRRDILKFSKIVGATLAAGGLLSACRFLFPEKSQGVECDFKYHVKISGSNGQELATLDSPQGKAITSKDEVGGIHLKVESQLKPFIDQVNSQADATAKDLSNLYPNTREIRPVQVQNHIADEILITENACPTPSDAYFGPESFVNTQEITSNSSYTTITKFSGDQAYITITSPGGSHVQYTCPTEWYDQILTANFAGGPAFQLPYGSIADTNPDNLSEEDYIAQIKASILNPNQPQSIQFNYKSSDLEGRVALGAVVIKAMELAASNNGKSTKFGMLIHESTGTNTATSLSMTTSGLKATGSFFLGNGNLNIQGGNSNAEYTQKIDSEEHITGAIFILNP